MTNSILISKVIYKCLSENTALTDVVGSGIYPLSVDADVRFPFIVFRRENIEPVGTKCGFAEDVVNFSVAVASLSYFLSLELANEIRITFEKSDIYGCGLHLEDVTLTDIAESYEDNCFIQRLSFRCNVTNYYINN